MQRLEVSGAVRPIYGSLGFKRLTYPHKKKSRGVISNDRGGQGVLPSLPIHLFGNAASKNRRTCEPQCGGAPSCWKNYSRLKLF